MFGFSLAELIVVIVVALVVIGPKDLPKTLRKLGQYAGKLRRMASELRAQSGIDEALRSEGLADDIAEIRKLARGELDSVQRSVTATDPYVPPPPPPTADYNANDFYVVRDREYPRDGADCFGALPDNAIIYAEGLATSKHARDPLYVLGDAEGILPPEPEPAPSPAVAEDASHDAASEAPVEHTDVDAEANANPSAEEANGVSTAEGSTRTPSHGHPAAEPARGGEGAEPPPPPEAR